MAAAYTPGLQVTERMRYRVRRILPIEGEVLVEVGQSVEALDIVARAELPGDVVPINLANQLSLTPADVPDCMLMQEGQHVKPGDIMARTNGLFGMFKSEYIAKTPGVIESISNVTGQVIVRGASIPVERRAYVTGTVAEVLPRQGVVIEAEVTLVQGIFGIGGEAFGPLRMACDSHEQTFAPERVSQDMQGAVLVGGARMTGDTVRAAINVGVAAIISGGIDDADLKEILGYDLGVAITGSEKLGITVIITEGFGDIAMAERTFQLLKSRAGAATAVNGATQIRAGVMRPEIVIPVETSSLESATDAATSAVGGGVLEPGTPVRIIRDPYFGLIGTVTALPAERQVLDSGSKARVLEVKPGSGETVVVPRANVEIIGGHG